VSQSPLTATVGQEERGYIQAWNQLGELAAAGKSFSGREKNCVFWNTGPTRIRRFADVSGPSGLDFPDDGRGLAMVDWDHDGDLDLWLSNRTAPRVRFMRNDLPRENHYLAIRLEGRSCNRDAIGARVEVVANGGGPRAVGERGRGEGGQSLASQAASLVSATGSSILETRPVTFIRTLRAGEGFLSQSSKWLHFGLGDNQQIEQVVVRWPGGDAETLTGLEVDRRYVIVQGSGEVRLWKPRRSSPTLKPSPPQPAPATNKARIVLVDPLPLPEARLLALDGKSQSVMATWEQLKSPTSSSGLLLNLWATWCKPCVAELQEISQREIELRNAGLEVMAISVDGNSTTNSSTSRTAANPMDLDKIAAFLQQLEFPFAVGVASLDLVRELDQLQKSAVSEKRAMPIPASFLVNRQGKVVVIYRGEVSIEQLLNDMSVLEGTAESRLRVATPFPGRWAAGLIDTSPLGSAQTYLESGYWDHAIRHLDTALKSHPSDTKILMTLGNLHAQQQQLELAVGRYQEVLAIAPQHEDARFRMAVTIYSQGNFRVAVEQLRKVLEIQPKSIVAINSLSWILATCVDDSIRNGEEAVRLAEEMNKATEHRDPRLLDTLAAAYAEAGRYEDAIRVVRAALELIGEQGISKLGGKLESRLLLYQENRPVREAGTADSQGD